MTTVVKLTMQVTVPSETKQLGTLLSFTGPLYRVLLVIGVLGAAVEYTQKKGHSL